VKARELIREVEKAGGSLVRKKGDHNIYKFRNGMVLSIPVGGRQTEVSDGMKARARRVIRANQERREVAF
jgi:predicted RNA binding protein YcfA (HicA-like mRNA interferase family)